VRLPVHTIVPNSSIKTFFHEGFEKSTEKGSKNDRMLCDRGSIAPVFMFALKSMRDMALSINLYLYNLMADERQRGGHEIVQSPEPSLQFNMQKMFGDQLFNAPILEFQDLLTRNCCRNEFPKTINTSIVIAVDDFTKIKEIAILYRIKVIVKPKNR
jgi:hypothetical protein